jgi:hypothetical protein
VTDGPSLAFVRSSHQTIAEAEADRIAAGGHGADVMIYDPNDLPDWVVLPARES